LLFFAIALRPEGLVERRQRQQGAARPRQDYEHIEVESQYGLDVERGSHRSTDGIAAHHTGAFQIVQDSQCLFHVRLGSNQYSQEVYEKSLKARVRKGVRHRFIGMKREPDPAEVKTPGRQTRLRAEASTNDDLINFFYLYTFAWFYAIVLTILK